MKTIKIVSVSGPHINLVYVDPVNWLLKIFHQNQSHSKNDYVWSNPTFLFRDNPDNFEMLANEVERDKVNVLGFSMYIWSRETILTLAARSRCTYKSHVL
jgi:hypothetical protein